MHDPWDTSSFFLKNLSAEGTEQQFFFWMIFCDLFKLILLVCLK